MAFASELIAQHALIVDALMAMPIGSCSELDDDSLLELVRLTAHEQQLVSSRAALLAGEVARRSEVALGSSGLAQRTGHRTAQELVRVTTGSTRREAGLAVRVGQMVISPDQPPWLAPLSEAFVAGKLSVSAVEAIRNGLGEPTDGIAPAQLRDAVAHLLTLAPGVDADRLYQLARDHRDAIDEVGIRDREAARRNRRGLRFRSLPDGMAQLDWTLDPESAAVVRDLFDRATSPRLGGPRFVGVDDVAAAQRVLDDERSTEQLASDVFLELLRQGAGADDSQVLGSGAPVVRVLVSAAALARREGHGRLEGNVAPVSIETVERLACEGSTVAIEFDASGQALDVGREQRLYTRRQRIALATRDGGCRWPGCDRPPSWTEAHHTRHWARDRGRTDIADGVLLCRHHHLLSHNNGWEITHIGGDYWLIPPSGIDPDQRPIPMPSRSAALRELVGAG